MRVALQFQPMHMPKSLHVSLFILEVAMCYVGVITTLVLLKHVRHEVSRLKLCLEQVLVLQVRRIYVCIIKTTTTIITTIIVVVINIINIICFISPIVFQRNKKNKHAFWWLTLLNHLKINVPRLMFCAKTFTSCRLHVNQFQ